MRSGAAAQTFLRNVDWAATAIWLLCFALVAYLGLEGGGYDALISDQVGLAIWWLLLLGVLVGAFPRRRPDPLALTALALLAAFVAWTALSLTWTESLDKTWADLARVLGYLGAFGLAIALRGPGDGRRIVGAVASAVFLVAVVGLLSRLHPSWFPDAGQTAVFLGDSRERLSYPLNYWNGLAAMIAIGLPALLYAATAARTPALRVLAAAALPAIGLASFFTFSRAGIATAVIVSVLFLLLTADRLPALATALFGGGGSAILIAALSQRDALGDGLASAAARQQGDEMLWITIAVCLVVAALQAGLLYVLRDGRRPGWTVVTDRQAAIAVGGAAVVVLLVGIAAGGVGKAADGWDEFKAGDGPGSGASRLSSAAGQNRYQYWSSAARENESKPLTGTGSGTFEFWWTRDGNGDIVRDTHSLYMQTFGELGIVGLVLLLAFLLTILLGGGRRLLRAAAAERPPLAAALAGVVAFCLTATFDWMWQIPALGVATLLLAAVLVGARDRDTGKAALGWPPRLGFAAAALIAIVAIAIPLASTTLLRQSEAEAREGNLEAALSDARSAQNVIPGAAGPRLQQALVLEQLGDLAAAASAAQAATEREETNWRPWLVLSRLEARRGNAAAAVLAFDRAKALNPHSFLFQ